MQRRSGSQGSGRVWFAPLIAAVLMVGGVGGFNPASAANCPTVGADGEVSPTPAAGVDWSGCDLSGAYLSSAELTSANLAGADLASAYLNGALLPGANLASANLAGAELWDADLSGADLTNADLTGAALDYATLAGADLSSANLTGARLYDVEAPGAVLRMANLADADVSSVNFVRADLQDANFEGAGLQYTWLAGARLNRAVLSGANLGYVTFSGKLGGEPDATYPAADLTDAVLSGAYGCPTFGLPIGLPDGYVIVDGCLPDTTPPVVSCDVPAPGPEFDKNSAGASVSGTSKDPWTQEQGSSPVPVQAAADTSEVGAFTVDLIGTDSAGNRATVQCPYTVVLGDRVAPTAVLDSVSPEPNANGWHSRDATARWVWSDGADGAGVDPERCTDTAVSVGEGSEVELTANCSDLADPANVGTASTVLQIDKTAPLLGSCPVAGPFLVGGGDQVIGPVSASDALSGIDAAASVLSATVSTRSVGPQTVRFSAMDRAGNVTEQSCGYSVAYTFDGFFSPVKGGDELMAKAGRTVPLKFRVAGAGGIPITDLSSVSVQVAEISCETGERLGTAVPVSAAGSSGLRNDGDGGYQINVKTLRSWAGSCRSLSLDLGDGVDHNVSLTLR